MGSPPETGSAERATLDDDLDQALRRIRSYAEIRLLVAGTANLGHQASSVDLLVRLVDDYAYAGLVTVVYDEGNPGCGVNVEKLSRLLRRRRRRLDGDRDGPETLPRRMRSAAVRWVSLQDFAGSEADSDPSSAPRTGDGALADFGLTGGAEIGRVYRCSLADMLNVRVALRAQPFQWPWCRDGIDFHSSSRLAPIDLLSSDRLGSRLFHTAYRLPRSMTMRPPRAPPEDGDGPARESESFLRLLLAARARTSDDAENPDSPSTSLSCVYGLRETNGVSQIDPANLLYIYFVALLQGATVPEFRGRGDEGARILVIDFDQFWGDAFARLQDYVHGRHDAPCPYSTVPEHNRTLPSSGNLSTCIRCIHEPEQLAAALEWLEEQPSPGPHTAATARSLVAAAHRRTGRGVKILYAHVGFVSPEAFVEALRQANLPVIFEGQHTASVVASLGKPYLKLQDAVLRCATQVIRIPDDMDRHGDVLDRIQEAGLSLQRGALGEMGFEESVGSVAGLVSECADPESRLNAYLHHLRSFYQRRGEDKFEQLLCAWNKFACLQQPERMSESDAQAAARRACMPRMLEEVVLDVENVRKMLAEFGL
ncbi:hypothetical protein E4U42_002524 [Claviceps africana]|uniref:Uncharacterized protein n=1 Tax=Claviceps africana TaxID=83212 RepID=A0A8K0J9C3_9HYPO|nr:hypothetical protein E4U42_002524 [Claviceps africana]